MNSKAIYAACLFAALNICTLPARAEVGTEPEIYTHGSQPDIQTVLSIVEESTPNCSVVSSRMTYLDTQGHERTLDYLKFAEACNDGD